MRVGIDLDGCVYDFTEAMQRYLVNVAGVDPSTLGTVDRWHVWECWGMTKDEWLAHFDRGVSAGVIFGTGEPAPGARMALERLRRDGHTIHVVTHRTQPKAPELTAAWLAENEIPYDTLTFVGDKTIVETDVFLEDNVANARALEAAGTTVALMDQLWNADAADLYRVFNWEQFEGFVVARNSMTFTRPKPSVLMEAEALVGGDRGEDYGHPFDDFTKTAAMLGPIVGAEVPAWKIPLIMIVLKISRELNSRKRDNTVDIAGYTRTLEMVYERMDQLGLRR